MGYAPKKGEFKTKCYNQKYSKYTCITNQMRIFNLPRVFVTTRIDSLHVGRTRNIVTSIKMGKQSIVMARTEIEKKITLGCTILSIEVLIQRMSRLSQILILESFIIFLREENYQQQIFQNVVMIFHLDIWQFFTAVMHDGGQQ